MSERKAEYYAKHLETLVEPEVQPIEQPTGLPTLLARMVTEFQVGLGDQPPETHEALANHFTIALLASAQPLLTEYLTAIATPPMMVVRETWTPPQPGLDDYRKYAEEGKKLGTPVLWYDEWRKSLGAK